MLAPESVIDPGAYDWLAEYPPPRSLPLDQEALRIYEHAYALGLELEPTGTPPITFTTVLAAILAGTDETSRWFTSQTDSLGPHPDRVFDEKEISRERVEQSRPEWEGRPGQVLLSTDQQLLTASARQLISTAEGWAQRVRGSDIGVRHLVASYVLNPPPAHRAQMQRWGYREGPWRAAFFDWVASRYTAEQWTDASQRAAPTRSMLIFEEHEIKGEALAFPGDEATLHVLARAAELHARRDDPWLRLQTVLQALIEVARESADVRDEILPLAELVERAGESYDRAMAALLRPAGEAADHVPFEDLDISPRVLNALETARGLAVATWRNEEKDPEVGVQHLAGAIVSRRVDGAEEIAALGVEPESLRRALIDHAVARHRGPIEVWREALGEEEGVVAGRPVELNSDEPEAVVRLDEEWTSDPLGIRRDVETFAALLASKKLEPPLSIGLFGPWGSGKTTFLRRLRRSVDERARAAKEAAGKGEDTPYVSDVVHVDFNAWHFAESALTSSLVDTVFRELDEYIAGPREVDRTAWREEKRKELETTRRKVEAAEALEAAAASAVDRAERALGESRVEAQEAATGLRATLGAAWTATKEALTNDATVRDSGVLEAMGEVTGGADELRERVEAVRARPARLLGDLGWPRSILFALMVVALPPAVAWVVGRALDADATGQALAMVATILTTVAAWLKAGAGAAARVDEALRRVTDAYEGRIESDPGVRASTVTLEAARVKAATAAAGLAAAREELARARTELASATVPAQMLQLVSDRIDAESYSRELTTVSLARADLDALGRLLRDRREEGAAEDPAGLPAEGRARRAVDRVILYIDDLDRCKPEDVVRVLQVVHMLLAFELFVVVVAVDARWVEESLRQSFDWLGTSDGGAPDAGAEDSDGGRSWVTPQDYLEKIFQIAFWLEPMSTSRAASFLGSLVRSPRREEGGPVFTAGGAGPPTAGSGTPAANAVAIAGIELDYLRALAAFVGSSPRRAKRLVNAYRLIKAGLSEAQLESFLTVRLPDGTFRSGPYQLVIGLLVIATGAPSSSARILAELAECDPRTSPRDIVDQFRAVNHPDWTMAAQVMETMIRTQKMERVSELRGWARKVSRFLLNRPATDARARATPAEPEPAPAGQPEDGGDLAPDDGGDPAPDGG